MGNGVIGVPLTQRQVAIIDAADLPLVRPFVWMALRHHTGRFYVRAEGGSLKLHRLLMDARPGQLVDHVNRNPLDNRRCNLRICNSLESSWNATRPGRTGYLGVIYRRNRWVARITINGRRREIGRFRSAEEAARAYDREALATRGSFAALNFPNE